MWRVCLRAFNCDSTSGKKATRGHREGIATFWRFSSPLQSLTDSQRLQQIKEGFPADLIQTFRLAFDLHDRHLETLHNASMWTPNNALGGTAPIMFCKTEIGAK